MREFLRAAAVATVLSTLCATVTWAAAPRDPVVGTWNLNVSKSKFSPGPAPKSQTRTYTQNADGTTLTVTGVTADGSPISIHSTFKYDGKDYPYTGTPNWDSLSLKRVNGTTVKSVLKKGGKNVGTSTRTLSAHGKVLTVSTKLTDTKGMPINDLSVYDKQ